MYLFEHVVYAYVNVQLILVPKQPTTHTRLRAALTGFKGQFNSNESSLGKTGVDVDYQSTKTCMTT